MGRFLTFTGNLAVELDVYPNNKDYLDELLEREHKQVFDAAYEIGGRRRSSKFDWNKYATGVFDGMCKQCARDKKPDVVKSLRSLEQVVAAPEYSSLSWEL